MRGTLACLALLALVVLPLDVAVASEEGSALTSESVGCCVIIFVLRVPSVVWVCNVLSSLSIVIEKLDDELLIYLGRGLGGIAGMRLREMVMHPGRWTAEAMSKCIFQEETLQEETLEG